MSLATDLYELTMAASYRALDMRGPATMSLFARKLPASRSYLVCAGLAEALRRVVGLGLDAREIDWLVQSGTLSRDDAEWIGAVRFTGDVWAVPEGRVVFANEPLLEIDAPIVEAQLLETLVLNAIHFPTTVATKASRCVTAALGKALVDFGLRRTPGIEAGLTVARACWLAGFAATSNVDAGRLLDIPISGTVAHSFIEALPSEREAFDAWARTAKGPITLLVDTYDTLSGVRTAVEVARALAARGGRLAAVRLDSGDLDALSRATRSILDESGLRDVHVFASGGLDEFAVDALVRAGAPIDGFGVGTRIGTSADAPVLDMAYKIVAYDGRPCLKLSEGKATVAYPKQVWRRRDENGSFVEDRITLREEPSPGPEWEPLLERVARRGEIVAWPRLADLRSRHAREMDSLPAAVRALDAKGEYRVSLSRELEARQRDAVLVTRAREGLV